MVSSKLNTNAHVTFLKTCSRIRTYEPFEKIKIKTSEKIV